MILQAVKYILEQKTPIIAVPKQRDLLERLGNLRHDKLETAPNWVTRTRFNLYSNIFSKAEMETLNKLNALVTISETAIYNGHEWATMAIKLNESLRFSSFDNSRLNAANSVIYKAIEGIRDTPALKSVWPVLFEGLPESEKRRHRNLEKRVCRDPKLDIDPKWLDRLRTVNKTIQRKGKTFQDLTPPELLKMIMGEDVEYNCYAVTSFPDKRNENSCEIEIKGEFCYYSSIGKVFSLFRALLKLSFFREN